MRRIIWISLTLLGLASACSSSKSGDAETADDGDGSWVDDTGVGEDGGALDVGASFWVLDGSLSIADGAVMVEASSLLLTLVSSDGTRKCGATVDIVTASDTTAPVEGLVSWWTVQVAGYEDDCSAQDEQDGVTWHSPLAEDVLLLGVGPLSPEMVAVLGSLSGLGEGAEASLNGAYASIDGGDVVVFGAAGPKDAYQGIGEQAVEAPLPDGTWYVRGLYTFSL